MNEKLSDTVQQVNPNVPANPNEKGNFSVDGYVKIFDPNTKEVILEKRA